MPAVHRYAVLQFVPYLFLSLAGCVPAAGIEREITGIATDGETVRSMPCWGLNDFGQVGDGTTGDAYLPVNVIGFSG